MPDSGLTSVDPYLVLLIEDDPNVRLYYADVIRRRFAVESFGDLASSIERLKRKPAFEAIALDLNLPNGAGIATIERMRDAKDQLGITAPIIAITGHDFDRWRVVEAGADELLRKPFHSPQDLLDALTTAIARSKTHRILGPTRQSVAKTAEMLERRNVEVHEITDVIDKVRENLASSTIRPNKRGT